MSFMNNSSMNSNIQDLSNQIIPESNPVHLFCESKGEINIPNEYGWTPLYRALVSNNIAAMTELLKLGADPNITNNMGETPLYQSVDNENFEAMTLLLENYADCNISKSDGMTPLHLAIKKGLQKEYVEKLLEFKANPNLKNRLYQQTPLHIAMKNKSDIEIVKLLLRYKADITIKDKYDSTPLDCCEDSEYKKSIENLLNKEEENKVTDNTNNMINIIDTTPNKDSEIVSKFSSSEVIGKGGDFNSNTPNTFLVNNNELSNNLQKQINNITNSSNSKNDELHSKYSSKTEIEHIKINTNNSLVSSDNKILKKNTFNNIIKTTPIYNPKQISKKPQTSTFNLSTPKENSCSSRKTNSINSNTYRENNIFTLENGMGSFLTVHSKKKSNLGCSDNKSGSKDMISEINPLEFINQVVTTTSNIFSELQNNTRDQQSLSQTKSDELVCEIKTPEKLDTKPNKEANNEDNNLNDSLEDHEMTYSKSKSYIVSELPITSVKKISPAKEQAKETNEKEDYSSHKVNLFNIIQKPSALNKISYHQNRNTSTTNAASATNTTMNANKENNLNIINLPYNMQQDTSKCSSSDYFYIEDNERTTSNTPVIPNNKYLNSSGGMNNNITDLDINNSNREYNPYSKNSVNSTRPTTSPYNMNSNKVLNISGAMKKQTISQLVMSPVYDGSTNSSNTNNNMNNYTLGGNSTYNSSSFRRHKKNSILTDYAVKTGQWNSTKIYAEEGVIENTNKNTPSFLSKEGNLNNYVDYRTKISAREAKRLHEWLLSADLLSYYNTLLDQGIYEIDKCIKGLSNGDLALSYKDIEDLGIRKPGHIYRFLLKMQCDSNMIDQRLVNYIIPNKTIGDGILRDSNCNINLGASQNCCGCAMIERRTVKELDIESWLRSKGLINLRENFLHNGFEVFEYVIIQMFSNYQFDENIITDCLHVYNAIDRKKLRLALLEEKRNICEKLGIKYLDMEMEETNRETTERCQICVIF